MHAQGWIHSESLIADLRQVCVSCEQASSLLAPATPLTSLPGDASEAGVDEMFYDPNDLSLRRAQPDLLFFKDGGQRETD